MSVEERDNIRCDCGGHIMLFNNIRWEKEASIGQYRPVIGSEEEVELEGHCIAANCRNRFRLTGTLKVQTSEKR